MSLLQRYTPMVRLSRAFCDKKLPPLDDLIKNSSGFGIDEKPDQWLTSAYAIDPRTERRLKNEKKTPVDKELGSSKTIILFPGQGSQTVGMTRGLADVPKAKEMFDFASSVMERDLLELCATGPKSELDKTLNCQMAIFVTSLATLERLKQDKPSVIDQCVATAGFSVGEFSSMVLGGMISFEDAVRMVKIRSEAMQICSEARPSGMVTIMVHQDNKLGSALKLAKEWCCEKHNIEDPVCDIANYLYPGCKVIGGDQEALNFLNRNGKEFGIRAQKKIAVSGAFHTRLMDPAENVLQKALEQIELRRSETQVMSNYDSLPFTSPESSAVKIRRQVCRPINWEQVMHKLFTRPSDMSVPRVYAIGPGSDKLLKILDKINRRASGRATCS